MCSFSFASAIRPLMSMKGDSLEYECRGPSESAKREAGMLEKARRAGRKQKTSAKRVGPVGSRNTRAKRVILAFLGLK